MTEWYDFPNVKSIKMLSFLFGSRDLRPNLPSPFGRKFLFCFEAAVKNDVISRLSNFRPGLQFPRSTNKPADKGKTTVIMDTETYKAECYQQLNYPKLYERLPKGIAHKDEDQIRIRLKNSW